MLEQPTKSTFDECLGSKFRIHIDEDEVLETELVEVSTLNSPTADGEARPQRDPFSIVFRSGENVALVQGIRRIEHETLGTLELFLVPIGPDQFEAVFT